MFHILSINGFTSLISKSNRLFVFFEAHILEKLRYLRQHILTRDIAFQYALMSSCYVNIIYILKKNKSFISFSNCGYAETLSRLTRFAFSVNISLLKNIIVVLF
ncbi:hypothetical protein EDEG_01336 [Edhazardia aedis USNM 41457]|uniref:Uncharacterized protein n=1 Tax=Edhazardia aedis (strain USNM 41457) TaxID=1003232 RepID=J9D9L9_EDHAE|nr:hypothetical protein EDEG_01336 [Edhazardia aedis USNM 41457]|eukprot:EJW04466.1 hypothetical protein EDEG_01336 [Edhazardia aedis USNM 41457]